MVEIRCHKVHLTDVFPIVRSLHSKLSFWQPLLTHINNHVGQRKREITHTQIAFTITTTSTPKARIRCIDVTTSSDPLGLEVQVEIKDKIASTPYERFQTSRRVQSDCGFRIEQECPARTLGRDLWRVWKGYWIGFTFVQSLYVYNPTGKRGAGLTSSWIE